MTKEKNAQQSLVKSTQNAQDTQANLINKEDETNKTDIINKQKHGLLNKIAQAPRCPHGSTPVKKMTLSMLNDIYDYSQKHKIDTHLFANILERLIALSDNHAGVKIYKLQYADAHFAMNHIAIAALYYEDFATLYPGSQEAEYALYKAVLCMFELCLSEDRDQSNTKKTIELAKEFLTRSPKEEYKKEIEATLLSCYNRLFDHEIYIFNFYLKRKKFTSARMRLDFMPKLFDAVIPDFLIRHQELTNQLDLAIHPVKVDKKRPLYKFLG